MLISKDRLTFTGFRPFFKYKSFIATTVIRSERIHTRRSCRADIALHAFVNINTTLFFVFQTERTDTFEGPRSILAKYIIPTTKVDRPLALVDICIRLSQNRKHFCSHLQKIKFKHNPSKSYQCSPSLEYIRIRNGKHTCRIRLNSGIFHFHCTQFYRDIHRYLGIQLALIFLEY